MISKRQLKVILGVLGMAVGTVLVPGGCGSTAAKQEGAALGPETLAPAAEPLAVEVAYPGIGELTSRVASFRIESGEDAGLTAVGEQSHAPSGSTTQRWLVGEKRTLRFERDIIRREDGALAMSEQRSIDRKVKTVFEPPLVVLPARLETGKAFTQTVKMTVHPIDRPKSIKEQGTAALEVALRGRQVIPALGRRIECSVVRSVFTADLKSADVVRTTDRWYSDEFGLVAEQYEETVKVFGVNVERTSQRFVLVAVPASGM